MSIYTPANIHSTVNSFSPPSNTGRYGLVDGLMRKGILRNLDPHRFLSSIVTRETIRKGQMFEEWIRYGNMGSEIHRLGTEILPDDVPRKRYRIALDERPRVSAYAIDDWEDFVSNTPAQAQLSDRMAKELMDRMETETLKQIILAGRDTGFKNKSDQFLGSGFTNVGNPLSLGAASTNAAIAAEILNSLDAIDEHWFDIASQGDEQYCLIEAPVWYAMRDLPDVFPLQTSVNVPWNHADIGMSAGPRPDQKAGLDAMLIYKGFKIIRSQLGKQVFGKDLSSDEFRAGNFGARTADVDTTAGTVTSGASIAKTTGVVFKPDAVAMVEAVSPQFESQRRVTFQDNAVVGSMLMGGGSLYAENAIELVTLSA